MSYWYDTGTPTFLVKLIVGQKINIVELGNMWVRREDFRKYDIENMRAGSLLEHYARVPESASLSTRPLDALYDGYIDFAMVTLKGFFAAILYDIIGKRELLPDRDTPDIRDAWIRLPFRGADCGWAYRHVAGNG